MAFRNRSGYQTQSNPWQRGRKGASRGGKGDDADVPRAGGGRGGGSQGRAKAVDISKSFAKHSLRKSLIDQGAFCLQGAGNDQ